MRQVLAFVAHLTVKASKYVCTCCMELDLRTTVKLVALSKPCYVMWEIPR